MWEDDLEASYSDDEYVVSILGRCPVCDKLFQWTETYLLKYQTEPIEVAGE
jgi:hypothetical protein